MKKKVKEKIVNFYYSLPIKRKISITNTVIAVILLFFITILANKLSSKIIIDKTIENSLQNLINISRKFDIIFENIENYSKAIVINNNVQKIMRKTINKKQPVSHNDYVNVKLSINNIVSSNKLVNKMIIYDVNGNIFDSGLDLYSVIAYKNFENFNMENGILNWIDTHRSNYLIQKGPNQIISQKNVISLVRIMKDLYSGKKLGVLETCVDEEYMADSYRENSFGNNSEIFVVNNKGKIVIHNDKNQLYSNITNKSYFNFVMGHNQGNKIFSIDKLKSLVIYKYYPRLDWTIIGIIPMREILKDSRILTLRLFFIGIICIVLEIIFSKYIADSITKPLIVFTEVVKDVEEGDLEARVNIKSRDELGILANEFNKMTKKTYDLMKTVLKEQKKKKQYELELLHSQIRPHFLYNTLENVCALADLNRNKELTDMVTNLSMFYRGVLSKGSNIIPVRDEIRNIECYLKILSVRYNDKLEYNIEIDDDIYEYSIIKLMLQPLVENSIYHGLKNKRGKGYITVKGFKDEDNVYFYIIDNGIGMKEQEIKKIFEKKETDYRANSFGLKSTNDRIKLYFGDEYGLRVESEFGQGTSVNIKLPAVKWRGV